MRTLSLLFFSACIKQAPPPPKIETCPDWDQAPEQGAFLQEDSTITLRSLVKTNSLCEEKLDFYRYTQRTESHSQGWPQKSEVEKGSGRDSEKNYQNNWQCTKHVCTRSGGRWWER